METIHLQAPLYDSFRVQSVSKMFDCDPETYTKQDINYEIPPMSDDWKIGLIVGPSGAGKSTVATKILGDTLYTGHKFPKDKAVIDCFPAEMTMQQITGIFTAVGFSSPPSWIKPYHVLSNGEKFRVDLAYALSIGKENDIVTFDEYTSVVDRVVAKTASMAIRKQIDKGVIKRRFVAVTCHYDLVEWLQPDWTLDMKSGVCSRGCQRRPEIHLEIRRTPQSYWQLFERHHYMRGAIPGSCICWCAFLEGVPIACVLVVALMTDRKAKRMSRWVVLPEFQGIGIGTRFLTEVAAHYRSQGYDVYANLMHFAGRMALLKSPDWKFIRKNKNRGQEHRQYITVDSRGVKHSATAKGEIRDSYTFRFRRGNDKKYTQPENVTDESET